MGRGQQELCSSLHGRQGNRVLTRAGPAAGLRRGSPGQEAQEHPDQHLPWSACCAAYACHVAVASCAHCASEGLYTPGGAAYAYWPDMQKQKTTCGAGQQGLGSLFPSKRAVLRLCILHSVPSCLASYGVVTVKASDVWSDSSVAQPVRDMLVPPQHAPLASGEF